MPNTELADELNTGFSDNELQEIKEIRDPSLYYSDCMISSQSLPEYPYAKGFVPCKWLRTNARKEEEINNIAIHVTYGNLEFEKAVSNFREGIRDDKGVMTKRSIHYVVGRAGEVIQMARHVDVAYHASQANSYSIGIEHCGNKDNPLTKEQLEHSAQLVVWICKRIGLSPNKEVIKGHAELSPSDDHACPNPESNESIFDWDQFWKYVKLAAT